MASTEVDVNSGSSTTRRFTNALVSGDFKLVSPDDMKIIDRLFVKIGSSSVRSCSSMLSDVWLYFGPLYLKSDPSPAARQLTFASTTPDSQPSTSTAPVPTAYIQQDSPVPNAQHQKPILIDSNSRYCEPCLQQFKTSVAASQHKYSGWQQSALSRLCKYSLSTATSAMIRHLHTAHNIVISNYKGHAARAGGSHTRPKLFFGNSRSLSAKSSTHSLHEDLVTWLARDVLPLSTVDSAAFHALFEKHLPRVVLPSSHTLLLSTVPTMYTSIKPKVLDCLSSADTICLMFDGWSDKHNARHFMGIRACLVTNDWTSKVVTLSCKPCGQCSNDISEHIATELADLGLTDEVLKKKVLFTSHNGGPVMLKASRILNSTHCQYCCSRSLNLLIMTDGINKIPALRQLIVSCKNIVTKLHFKGDIVEREMMGVYSADIVAMLLAKIESAFEIASCDVNMPVVDNEADVDIPQNDSGAGNRKQHQEAVTRWNSTLEIINSLLVLKDQVNEALKRTGHYDLLLKTLDWNTLFQIAELLESFQVLTEIATGSSVCLSVIPLIRAKLIAACNPTPNDKDCEEIVLLKRKLLDNLDFRFPVNDFVNVASLLDPASKNKKYLNLSFEQKRDLLVDAIHRAENGQVVSPTSVPQLGQSHIVIAKDTDVRVKQEPRACSFMSSTEDLEPKSKRLRIMDEFEDDDSASDIVAMVTQYLSVNEKPSEEERADPLLYWKYSRFTDLASLAKIYLTANASSVPCDSMFSVSGMLLNGRRSSLAPHTFNQLIFIHDNNAKFSD